MRSPDSSAARNRRALNVLELALELEPALRGAYLETLGRQDGELRQQVQALLKALGQGAPEPDATTAEPRLQSLEMPDRVGPYKVIREIGRGGMSRVYLAERADEEFERQVALKVIDQGLEAPIVHQRFLAERQILASFDCPQIAKLFDGGTLPNGRPYLVMELVEGVRVDQFCAEHRLGLRERLQLFRQICGAVSYAHQKLVVHRDLKPSNILVKDSGEPKLLDFGIAKLLDPESFPLALSEATRSHFRPMTPSYASPEQLFGEPITTSTDVYALGVLLFQLLTGELPSEGEDRLQQVLRQRTDGEAITKPSESLASAAAELTWGDHDRRRLGRQLRGDLDNIVAKALRPHTADRYASVAELDEDLHRYLEGEPVRATRETPVYLLGKFLRRYRLPVAVAATVLSLVSAFAFAMQRQADRIAEERDRANEIRGFMADLIGSADTQSRRSGSVSLKSLLDENRARLQQRPFADSQVQFELLELMGDGYRSIDLHYKAMDVYSLALREDHLNDSDRNRVLLSLGSAAGQSGHLPQAVRILQGSDARKLLLDRNSARNLYFDLIISQEARGDFQVAAVALREVLNLLSVDALHAKRSTLSPIMRNRLSLTYNTQSDVEAIQAASTDLLAIMNTHPNPDLNTWIAMSRAYSFVGQDEEALASHRFIVRLTDSVYRHELSQTYNAEYLAESLLRNHRLPEAQRASRMSLRSARELVGLDPASIRAEYQLAHALTRDGEIHLALGNAGEAATSFAEAITLLEPMARETPIIFAKSTLARAYLLTGRLDEARSLMQILLEQGFRRPDLMSLAAEKGVLPDPLPPPLDLDLSLPPKVRAYIDSLPRKPPPWRTATDLPTIEEILAAEEARMGIAGPTDR